MRLIILVLLLAGLSGVGVAGADVVLVKDGKPAAAIVAQDDAKANEAARAIQKYVAQMSGATLPIIVDGRPTPPGDSLILVGHTSQAAKLGIAIPSGYDPSVRPDAFSKEGYVIKTFAGGVVVGGNNDGPYQGTIYAAYALLQKLGCRWYFPGEWGEVIPRQKTIVVPEVDLESRPDFAERNIWLSGWVPVTAEERKIYQQWCLKLGMTGHQTLYPKVGDGFLGYLLPPDEFFDKHPEYYASAKAGPFHVTAKSYPRLTMLCLANPDVLSQSIKNLAAAFAGKSPRSQIMRIISANGFGISPPDGMTEYNCPGAKEASQDFRYPEYAEGTMFSEEYFSFAAQLARQFPDKYVSTMAYSLREMPPQGVSIPPNMMVLYAPISCDVLHPDNTKLWRRADFVQILKDWRRRTPHLVLYDYNPGMLTGFFLPERDSENMAINAPIYKEIGIKGMSREGRKAFMQTWISYYVTARLLWDSHADLNAIKDDFYTTFFGPKAGPYVRRWWDACAQRLVDAKIQAHEDFLINHLYDLKFVQGISGFVQSAESAVASGTNQQKERVKAFALITDHLDAFARMTDAEERMNWKDAASAAGRMIDDEQALSKIYPFFISVDEKHVRPYFAGGRKATFLKHESQTDGQAGTLVAKLPLEAPFTYDPHNRGVIYRWYAPGFDDSAWRKINTFFLWDQQLPFLDDEGHDYNGYGWYRMQVDVPARFKDKPVHLYLGGLLDQGWIWVNGQYAGRSDHHIWWDHDNDFDIDISRLIKPGQSNLIAVRVWNDADYGGIYRRGYLWSPIK